MSKKYELVESSKIILRNIILYRIKALIDIPNIVKAGELGGYIESEKNLSHEGNCWVSDDAYIYNNAYIYGNAKVYGDAQVYGNAQVSGKAQVYGKAKVGKDALILSNDDYTTISGFGRENRTTTFYLSHNNIIMVDCGCFKGTLDEFENKVNKTHKKGSKYWNQYLDAISIARNIIEIK